MNTVLRASGSAEFLALVPTLAGYTPRRSLVLLPFSGSRTHGAMRVDLPPDDADADAVADAVIGLVSRVAGTDAVAVVVYTDDGPQPIPDGLLLPHWALVEALLDTAEETGLRVVDALCVTSSGWACYLDDEPELRPLERIPQAPRVPGIAAVDGDQDAGAELPRADLAEKERVGRALADLDAVLHQEETGRIGGERMNPQALDALAMLDDLPAFFEALLDAPANLPPFAAAGLLWCLDRPIFRDVAVVQWATDLAAGRRTLTAQLAASAGAAMPDELGGVFLGQGPRPDPDRLRVALEVVRLAAARAPRASRVGPLTVAAWLSWALGRSSHAAYYLRLAAEIDPEYGLASLLRSMVDGGMLPDWAFRPA